MTSAIITVSLKAKTQESVRRAANLAAREIEKQTGQKTEGRNMKLLLIRDTVDGSVAEFSWSEGVPGRPPAPNPIFEGRLYPSDRGKMAKGEPLPLPERQAKLWIATARSLLKVFEGSDLELFTKLWEHELPKEKSLLIEVLAEIPNQPAFLTLRDEWQQAFGNTVMFDQSFPRR